MLVLFLSVQLLGLYVGISLMGIPEFVQTQVTPVEPTNPVNSFIMLGYVVFGAAFLIALLKFYRGVVLFKLLESAVIFITSNVVFFAILHNFFGFYISVLASVIFSLLLTMLKFFEPRLKNLTAAISSAGVGAVFGVSLGFIPLLIFVVGLAIYDIVSVFLTRHMVIMARELSRRQMSFSVSAMGKPSKRDISKLQPEERKKEEMERTVLELGTGDIAIPLMLAVSAYRLGCTAYVGGVCIFSPMYGLAHSLIVICGSAIALFFILDYVIKEKAFLPALPPIAFGGVASLLLFKIVEAMVSAF